MDTITSLKAPLFRPYDHYHFRAWVHYSQEEVGVARGLYTYKREAQRGLRRGVVGIADDAREPGTLESR